MQGSICLNFIFVLAATYQSCLRGVKCKNKQHSLIQDANIYVSEVRHAQWP